MEKMTQHPLRMQADILKRALAANGFTITDDSIAPELQQKDWAFELFQGGASFAPITLEGGYVLRRNLLCALLPRLKGSLPLKVVAAGEAYDAHDAQNPGHQLIEGLWAGEDFSVRAYRRFWETVAKTAYGLAAEVELKATGPGSYEARASIEDASFVLARTGKLGSLARALLGLEQDRPAWAFTVDVDEVAAAVYGLSRQELYTPLASSLKGFASSDATFSSTFVSDAVDTLRAKGFTEFGGLRVYPADCYKKMNMIQEAWDKNNSGIELLEPLGEYSGLPTVLTPSLEEALAANWKAGEKNCLLFEVRHIFLPNREGSAPIEKRAISFGGYAEGLDKQGWRKLVGEVLDGFGFKGHFFIPLPFGAAPAYDFTDGWLVMDKNMQYQESNFGSISPKALANHGIETQAFMAQFELEPIAAKAAEEFEEIPNELK